MVITLRKLSGERHRLDVLRDDGSAEGVELEIRSLLLHDLVHYAVESEWPIPDGFWGGVASGAPLVQGDLAMVGLTGHWKATPFRGEMVLGWPLAARLPPTPKTWTKS